MCTAEQLVDGVDAAIAAPLSSSGLVLGAMPTAVVRSSDPYQSTGLEVARNLTGLYPSRQQASGHVELSIQGRQFLSQAQAVPKRDPSSIAAVLRTREAWVDRVKVRVAYQVKDVYGSAVVSRPSRVTMVLSEPTPSTT